MPPTKKRRGRPRVMTDAVIEDILRIVRAGHYVEKAAEACGISPATMRKFRSRNRAFDAAVQRAEAVAEASIVVGVRRQADAGDAKAAQWVLERRWPERWARPEIRVQLQSSNIDTDALVKGLLEGQRLVAERHMPRGRPEQVLPPIDDDPQRPGGIPLIPRAAHPSLHPHSEAAAVYVVEFKDWTSRETRHEVQRDAAELALPLVVVGAPEHAFVDGPEAPPADAPASYGLVSVSRS